MKFCNIYLTKENVIKKKTHSSTDYYKSTSKYLRNGWWATFKLHKQSRTNDIYYLDIRAYNLHKILQTDSLMYLYTCKIQSQRK